MNIPSVVSSVLLILTVGSCALEDPGESLWVAFPAAPESWIATLGEPKWSLRWFSAGGEECRRDGCVGGSAIDIDVQRSSPVLAWPYWPDRGLFPGEFFPAGAVSPFALEDGQLELGWLQGVSAWFFRELAIAGTADRTLPERFDWPRFEALLQSTRIPEAIRADPWLVDWRKVAAKTRILGFDSRRLVSGLDKSIQVTLPSDGPWVSASPFVPGAVWAAGETLSLPSSAAGAILASRQGLLRYSSGCSAWFPFPK